MTGNGYQEQTMPVRIGESDLLTSGRVGALGLVLMLVALGGCGGEEAMSEPDRSTIRGLAEYVLWTFRIDSIEEFEKVNPPMELIELWVGKDDPDWPMVAAMAMGMRRDSLNHWKEIKKLAGELGIDWRKTIIVDVRDGGIFASRSEGVDFQGSSGVGVLFETNGKRWALGLDDPMRRADGPWYIRDGLKWKEEDIRASIQSSVTGKLSGPQWRPRSSDDNAIQAPKLPSATAAEVKAYQAEAIKRQLEAAKALGAKVSVTLDLGKGAVMKLSLVPAGKFPMGSKYSAKELGRKYSENGESYVSEHPQHEVTISKPFYMGIYEVTQGQWRAVMGSEPWKGKKLTKSGDAYAASHISWDDATRFCEKLSKKTGKKMSLPTEAQWEYACRAGYSTLYCFGDDETEFGDYGWYRYDYSGCGCYYVTICTQGRKCLLGEVVNGEMVLNHCGRIAHEEWFRSADVRAELRLDGFVVMPNHIHGIVFIDALKGKGDPNGPKGDPPVAPTGLEPKPRDETSRLLSAPAEQLAGDDSVDIIPIDVARGMSQAQRTTFGFFNH